MDRPPLQEPLVAWVERGNHNGFDTRFFQRLQFRIGQWWKTEEQDQGANVRMGLERLEELVGRHTAAGGHHEHRCHLDPFRDQAQPRVLLEHLLESIQFRFHGRILIRAGVAGHDQHQAFICQQLCGFLRRHGAEDIVGIEIELWRAPGERKIEQSEERKQPPSHR